MINRQALAIVLAAAATIQNTNAFIVAPTSSTIQRSSPMHMSSVTREEDIELTRKTIIEHASEIDKLYQAASDAQTASYEAQEAADKLIMDIPPMPVAPSKPAAAAAIKKVAPKKKGKNPHKEGIFSPIVVAAGAVMGEETLNKVRGKVIAIHSDLIKSFVDTADSSFGQSVLKQIFNLVDTDNSGYLDKSEVAVALNMLGFKWLKDKHVGKIFERADANGDLEISLEEFMIEAPKTLRTNLVKLAKNNGGEMGLLV